MLNYHGAHDIGHALQDLMLVGCTSFAANMGSADSSFIIGRNFDFFISEAFAEDKIICFVNPSTGHRFAYVTWASFIGVVSGINAQGLTVTINAGRSDIPTSAATPISLLAREILQYAGNIGEAIAIAEKRKTFVSESLLIGSAKDNRAVIIEKSPSTVGIYETGNEWMVCANHFQSEAFDQDEANREHKFGSPSNYRQQRASELLTLRDTLTYTEAANILRDRNGLEGQPIGVGNEKAMAQMISHHSVIMMPRKHYIWVSTAPYQFGPYLSYSLDDVFTNPYIPEDKGRYIEELTIPADPFLATDQFSDFMAYRLLLKEVIVASDRGLTVKEGDISKLIELNPEYYEPYVVAGDYYASRKDATNAEKYYEMALEREIPHEDRRRELKDKIRKLP